MRPPFESRFAARLRARAAARAAAAAASARGAGEAQEKAILERIKTLSDVARGAWFGLIGYLAFVGLTLLGVRDIDFFALEARTQLPLVGVAIPTYAFFWAAPWLGAALHAWLHLHMVKLWDALAEAPAEIAGGRLGERVFPWLATDWALRRRPDRAAATVQRPLGWLSDAVAALLVWWAAPVLIGLVWWRSMPAHDEGLTLLIAGAVWLSAHTTLRSRRRALARLRAAPSPTPPEPPRVRRRWSAALAAGLVAASWLRTEGGFDHHAGWLAIAVSDARMTADAAAQETDDDREARHDRAVRSLSLTATLAPLNLVNADLAKRPADWANRDTAERRFRMTWCRDRGVPAGACLPPHEDDFSGSGGEAGFAAARAAFDAARSAWCGDDSAKPPSEACVARVAALYATFDTEWTEQRAGALANLAKPAMRGADLRGAQATGAFLAGLNLSWARMEGANLRWARMEGANLRWARMEGADLRWARMEGADLRWARMEGADLIGARMEGADLREAQLKSVAWAGATIGPSPAHATDFTAGTNLEPSQLDLLIGDDDTTLPPGLHVWSCWETPPPGLDAMLERAARLSFDSVDDLRARWLCSPDNPRRKVGRTAPAP